MTPTPTPVPSPQWAEPSTPSQPKQRRNWAIGAGSAAVALVLIIAGFVVLGGRDAKAITVTLVPLSESGEGPFTASVVTVSTKAATDFANRSRKSGSGEDDDGLRLRSASADTAGLYGVSPGSEVCNATKLVGAITGASDRKAAWADAMDVAESRIGAEVEAFTPVLLAHDTAFTEAIFVDGRAQSRQIVAQAGTTVFVDDHGAPVARCASGNPLGPPQGLGGSANATVTGEDWPGFAPAQTVEIEPFVRPMTQIEAVDIETGEPITTPLGGSISLDGYLVANDDGVSVVSTDAKRTTRVLDHHVARAFDDGAGGVIYQEIAPEGTDREGFRGVLPDLSRIMILRAGATDPEQLISSDDPEVGVLLWDVGTFNGKRSVAYEKILRERPAVDGSDNRSEIRGISVHDLTDGTQRPLKIPSLDGDGGGAAAKTWMPYGPSGAVGAVSFADDQVAVYWGYADTTWTWFDKYLAPMVDVARCNVNPGQVPDRWDCFATFATAIGHDRMVTLLRREGETPRIVEVDAASGGILRSTDLPGDAFTDPDVYLTPTVARGEVLYRPVTSSSEPLDGRSYLLDVESWDVTTIDIPGSPMLLRAPIRRPRAGGPGAAPSTTAVPTTVTPTTVPPTTAPPLKAPTWDEIKNASIPALCTHEPTTLVDGKDVTLDGPDPTGQRVYRGMYELDPTELVSGLPSDAGPLTLVGVQCNAGGVGWPGELAAFSAGGVFYDQINPSGHGPGTWDDYQNSASNSGYYEFRDLWTAAGFDGPSRVTVTGLTLEGDHVRFTMGAKRPGECEACATGTATVTVSVQGGRLHVDSVTAD